MTITFSLLTRGAARTAELSVHEESMMKKKEDIRQYSLETLRPNFHTSKEKT